MTGRCHNHRHKDAETLLSISKEMQLSATYLLMTSDVLTLQFNYKLTLMYIICHLRIYKLPNTLYTSKRLVAP
jgi:hypothetical protein